MTKQQIIKQIEDSIYSEDKVFLDLELISWIELIAQLDLTKFNVSFKNNVLIIKHKAFNKKAKIEYVTKLLLNGSPFEISNINQILHSILTIDKMNKNVRKFS